MTVMPRALAPPVIVIRPLSVLIVPPVRPLAVAMLFKVIVLPAATSNVIV